ncbi:hypothetical protein BpHYR1_002297 [Brachionus plicatilis]|uniref:Uncharacterized protein n=1 Tax=Brachionus plicatilis TaxID=10195 RepID=A0A3M7RDX3_BRAPC|nr:hypothetical protein BpHYR1_002297 [Brachionus plicatilis]
MIHIFLDLIEPFQRHYFEHLMTLVDVLFHVFKLMIELKCLNLLDHRYQKTKPKKIGKNLQREIFGKICKSLQKNYPLKIASFRWCAFCIVHFDIAELIFLFNILTVIKKFTEKTEKNSQKSPFFIILPVQYVELN